MKYLARFIFSAFCFLGITILPAAGYATCTLEFEVEGAIGPATYDLIERAIARASELKCVSILATINTPGGNLQTTRMIVEKILNSDIPFLCLVSPAGGHAGSAGAIILQACHVAGALETTNIGAATPVASSGEQMPEDLRKKLINDTKSWIEGIARLRGRDPQFAKDIVEEAKAVTAVEAKKLKAIEWVGVKKSEFLAFSSGREVKLKESVVEKVEVGDIVLKPLDTRYRVMSFITNPQFAYLLFMGSIGLLYFELTHPGMIAPGVVGAIGLAVSLVSMHMLDVQKGGLILIFLGILLMILEAFITSYGVLGIGGVISFFLGSLFLYEPGSGYELPLSTILPTTIFLVAVMVGISYLALTSRNAKMRGAYDSLIGHEGLVSEVKSADGKFVFIDIDGETWKAVSEAPLKLKDKVEVYGHEGFTLKVKQRSV